MRLWLSLLGALLVSSNFASATIAIYYGTVNTGTLNTTTLANSVRKSCLAIVDLDAASGQVNVRFIYLSPPTQAGKNFDYNVDPTQSFRSRVYISVDKIGATAYTGGSFNTSGSSNDDALFVLAGLNVTLPLSNKSSATRSVADTLSGRFVYVNGTTSTGSIVVQEFALKLLVPTTQYENGLNRTLDEARQDTEAFYNSIGGHKVDF